MKLFVSSFAAFALTVALVGCGGGEAPKAPSPTMHDPAEAMKAHAGHAATTPAGEGEKKADEAAAPADGEKKADEAAAPADGEKKADAPADGEKKADAPAADAKPEEKKAE